MQTAAPRLAYGDGFNVEEEASCLEMSMEDNFRQSVQRLQLKQDFEGCKLVDHQLLLGLSFSPRSPETPVRGDPLRIVMLPTRSELKGHGQRVSGK